MTSKTPGRGDLNGSTYRKLRAAAILRSGGICCLCGGPIDLALSGRHRDGPTLEHIIPVSRGGDPLNPDNHGVSHNRCNSARKDKLIAELRAQSLHPSRAW